MDSQQTLDSKITNLEKTTPNNDSDDSYEDGKILRSHFIFRWMKKFSIERTGIQRVTEKERQYHTTHVWNAATFWLSANTAVATLSTGMAAASMGLSFWDCFAVIVVMNLLSCLLPAWTATFGLTGLRMTTFSRYSFGYWGNLLVVIFSMVSTTGWNVINSISGASCLHAASDGTFPQWAGVLIICTVVWLICSMGITWIHQLDAYLWIPPMIVWCVAAGTGASHFDGHAKVSPTGADGAASALSCMALIFSFAVSWINCAADYNVRMPINTPRSKIFVATYFGILVPTIIVQTLGAAMYSGTVHEKTWLLAYKESGVGGVLEMSLKPAGGFGKFLLVLAGLSSIPNNIPNNYSFAMHAQNFGPWALRIPRIILVTFGYVAAVIVGCFAAQYFHDSLQTFLSVIGYWTVIHLVVIAEEHIFFRRHSLKSYNFDVWDNPAFLPFGWAAIGAFCFGFLGAALGMKTTWYVAPIAGTIGKGANIGHELTFGFCALTFPIFRWLEKRVGGK